MSEVTEQIKERINVAELVGEYLKLEKAGTNYKALCPFHNEKTPSFMVNPERNFWYCFGCQKGGDIFSFIQEIEGIDFREALEKLAEKTGVEIPRYQKIDKSRKDDKKTVYEILEIATRYYQNQLTENPVGKEVINYLKKRRITGEQARDFKIGYSPNNWDKILNLLTSKGYKIEDINKSGILVEKDNGGKYYDRFRNRIMFPVIDVNGKIIGFSARSLPGQDKEGAKYINTPQTIVYDKSQILYGIYQARTEIRKKDFIILVEGNMDVIASFSSGIKNIVAVSGTAFTSQQVNILKRYTTNFKFCFDMDEAGQNATKKSIQTCLKEGVDVEIINLPSGFKDVNDLVIEDQKEWYESINKSIPVMEYFMKDTFNKYSLDRAKDKKMIAQELLNIIKDITDPIEKNFWLKKISQKLDVEEDVLTEVLEKVKVKSRESQFNGNSQLNNDDKETKKIIIKKTRIVALQERLLGVLSLYKNELIEEIEVFDKNLLYEEYQVIWDKIISENTQDVKNRINQFEVSVKYSYDPNEGFSQSEIDLTQEWALLIKELRKERKKELLNKLSHDLKEAEENQDKEAIKVLSKEFSNVCKEFEEI